MSRTLASCVSIAVSETPNFSARSSTVQAGSSCVARNKPGRGEQLRGKEVRLYLQPIPRVVGLVYAVLGFELVQADLLVDVFLEVDDPR